MSERRLELWVLIVLIGGGVLGAGLSYLVMGPKVDELSKQIIEVNRSTARSTQAFASEMSQMNDLEQEQDTKLEEIRGDLESLTGDLNTAKSSIAGLDIALKKSDQEINDLTSLIGDVEGGVQNEDTIIRAYNNVSPAVVFITSTALTFDFQLQQEVPTGGVGSGVVVSPEGYILTNNHVVEGAETVTVSFKPGEEIMAEIVGTDPPTDLAVIKIDPPGDIPVASLGNSDEVVPGMTAIAIGNPFSLERTVTVGVVSSVNRTLDAETGDIIFGIIQTDASINPGNSGGALVNSNGEVIGINSAIISPVQGSVGIGFSIPINLAKKVMTQLIEKGHVSRPYIGITGTSTEPMPPELGLPEKGVLIIDVFIDSPADKAGVMGSDSEVQVGSLIYPVGGDVIISAGGQGIDTIEDLLEFLSTKDVGETIELGIIRNGLETTLSLTLEERPSV